MPLGTARGLNHSRSASIELPRFQSISYLSWSWTKPDRPISLFLVALISLISSLLRCLTFICAHSSEPWLTVLERIANDYTVLKPLDQDRFPCSFLHIFASGYAAGYYSYKWAEVSLILSFLNLYLSARDEAVFNWTSVIALVVLRCLLGDVSWCFQCVWRGRPEQQRCTEWSRKKVIHSILVDRASK